MRIELLQKCFSVVVVAIVMVLAGVSGAQAAVPVKEVLTAHFGREVDLTKVEERRAQELAKKTVTVSPEEEDVCTVASKDMCQPGKESSEPGGFAYPEAGA